MTPRRGGAMAQYILSDPNMSDGTHPEVIEAIMDQLRGRDGMKLIGYEPDADFDRLPAEILGRPEVMREALLDMAGKAYELIDMEKQHGRHPRVGAVDTIEVYPAKGITIEEVREFCEDLGQELYERYEVPIYFTGKNARRPENAGLTFIRKGNYEGLKEAVLVDPDRAPDIGPARLHPIGGSHDRRRPRAARRLLQRGPRHGRPGDRETSRPMHPQQDRRLHERPGHHRPAADSPPHREEGRRRSPSRSATRSTRRSTASSTSCATRPHASA